MGPYSMDLRERVAAAIDEGEGSERKSPSDFASVSRSSPDSSRGVGTPAAGPQAPRRRPRPVLGSPNRYDWRC